MAKLLRELVTLISSGAPTSLAWLCLVQALQRSASSCGSGPRDRGGYGRPGDRSESAVDSGRSFHHRNTCGLLAVWQLKSTGTIRPQEFASPPTGWCSCIALVRGSLHRLLQNLDTVSKDSRPTLRSIDDGYQPAWAIGSKQQSVRRRRPRRSKQSGTRVRAAIWVRPSSPTKFSPVQQHPGCL